MDKFAQSAAALAAFALKRPVTISMLFLSLLLLGLISSRLLPLEKFPGIDIPEIQVQIPYPDAPPAETERLITKPVEEVLATMTGIKRLRSWSNQEGAFILLQFDWGQSLSSKRLEAREKIDTIRDQLPSDVERVLVYQFNTNDLPIFQLRVSSEKDLSNAYDLLNRNLKMPIERLPGVSKVELYGVMEKQISIRLDAARLAALHLDGRQLAETLTKANFSISGGEFYHDIQTIRVSPQGQFQSLDDIRNLVIKPGLRLQDVASVGYETPEMNEGRHLDQSYAVGFNIFRESGSNLVDVSERVMKVINEAKDNPAFSGISLFVMDDEAKSVKTSLNDVLEAGLLGALLSFLVLYAFLRDLKTTLIVVLSVPFAICITLGCMYFMGYSLNVLSLMGLMLAIGMLVDNAVVVTESIFQEQQESADEIAQGQIKPSIIRGVAKVSLAVIAGTLTTAIVFLPNIVGDKVEITIFLEHVAIAICISLLASLLISQTLIPLLASKIRPQQKPANLQPGRWSKGYQKALAWTLNRPGWASLIAVLILVSTMLPMQVVSGDNDNNGNNDRIWLNYNIQQGYSLEEVEQTVQRMEQYLYDNQDKFEIQQVYSYYRSGHAVSGITLKPEHAQSFQKIKELINENMPVFVRAKPSFRWNEGSGGGVRVTLLGESSDSLLKLADDIIPLLSQVEGLADVRTDMNGQQHELRLTLDRDKVFRFGLNSKEVAQLVATALRGQNLRTFRYGDHGEIKVQLLFDESIQEAISALKRLPIKQQEGQTLTLGMLAEFSIAPRYGEIKREYRQTAIVIGANLKEGTTMDQARERITKMMEHISLPQGNQWTLDGGFRQRDESDAVMLVNMLLAICMIYIVMAALFESILLPTAVITSLLFSVTGVFWAFLFTGTNMSTMALIGMLILMGIVVNNGIVLVDRINQLWDEGVSLYDAIIQGCSQRVRPIMMTVATTVLGLVPLAMGNTQIAGDGPPYAPMAIAIIGGLVFSTLTSLLLVPLAYWLLIHLRQRTGRMLERSKLLVDRVIKA